MKHGVKHSQVQLNFAYDKKSAELVAEISNFFSEFNEETWQKNIRYIDLLVKIYDMTEKPLGQ